jgi:hypothetical protein
MLDVAVAWEICERVGNVAGSRDAALALGYVGLVLALPVICFALPAGHIAIDLTASHHAAHALHHRRGPRSL